MIRVPKTDSATATLLTHSIMQEPIGITAKTPSIRARKLLSKSGNKYTLKKI